MQLSLESFNINFTQFLQRFNSQPIVKGEFMSSLSLPHLQYRVRRWGGRNNRGCVVVRGRRGRFGRHNVCIDRFRRLYNEFTHVVKAVRLGSQTGKLGCCLYANMGLFSYVLGWHGIKRGVEINYAIPLPLQYNNSTDERRVVYVEQGGAWCVGQLPIGSYIYNIEKYPGRGGMFTRAAGTYSRILQKIVVISRQLFVAIRLRSGQLCYVHGNCRASVGQVANVEHRNYLMGKAGTARKFGWRSLVRGVAMNPVDHPHGGGEGKTSGGRSSVSAWGVLTKGKKTLVKKKRQKIKQKLLRFQRGG